MDTNGYYNVHQVYEMERLNKLATLFRDNPVSCNAVIELLSMKRNLCSRHLENIKINLIFSDDCRNEALQYYGMIVALDELIKLLKG